VYALIRNKLLISLFIITDTLGGSVFINRVSPALTEINKKDNVVAEAANSRHGRHADNESKQVVDKSVDKSVTQDTPRQMCNALEFVVQEKLGCHSNKTKCINASTCSTYEPRVPTMIFVNDQTSYGERYNKRQCQEAKLPRGVTIDFHRQLI